MSTFFTIRDHEVVQKSSIKKAFDLADGTYELDIKKRNKRSLQQNRYYFGVCIKMIREKFIERGYEVSMEDVHDMMRFKFNYIEIIDYETGEIERLPKSTTGLNKDEFGKYIEKIQQYAAQSLDLVIPDPGEQLMLSYD
jgi:hypothetical protein